MQLSIFNAKLHWLDKKICISGVKEEVKEIVQNLGGPSNACALLDCKYTRLKEWLNGRSPAPIHFLLQLLSQCKTGIKHEMKRRIESKEITLKVQYSPHKMKFPRKLSPELAYISGLILGDGHLASDEDNAKGNWGIYVCFDDLPHLEVYKKYVREVFGIEPKHYFSIRDNCFVAYFASMAVHWFLRNYLEIPNGNKSSRIQMPQAIAESDEKIVSEFIGGLFDSDGTITKQGAVKFSSTSVKIVQQVKTALAGLSIKSHYSSWLKSEKYKMLHTLKIGKASIHSFEKTIGFKHPRKKQLLKMFSNRISSANSPVV